MTEDADGGVSIIDAGLKLATDRILRQLAASGRQPTDVKRIIITHAHPDHVGGLPSLQAATGAEVIASFVERPYVEGKAPMVTPPKDKLRGIARMMSPSKPPTLAGTPVDRDVADGEMIPETFGGMQVIFTPGHSPGHISLWQPQKRVLITGDVVMKFPVRGWSLPFSGFTPDMDEDRRSVQRIAALEPLIVCFGHGTPITENAAAQLKAFAAKC